MTRSEKILKLRQMGMSPAAEKELKELWQVQIKGRKAKTDRSCRQQEHRWNKVGKPLMGVGYYWFQLALQEGLD